MIQFISDQYCSLICLQCFDTVGWHQDDHPACKKIEWWRAGVVTCLEWGNNGLNMVQLMPQSPHHLLLH